MTLAGGALLLLAAVPSGQERIQPRPIIIIGGTIVDGTGARARRNSAIVIEDGRIKAMGLAAPKHGKDARLIDATGRWILPGLIDAAVHLTETGGADEAAGAADIHRAPARYLRAYLCAGITSVLNLGGSRWTFDLRAGRSDEGMSPRISTTGPRLAPALPAGRAEGDEGYSIPSEQAGVQVLVDRLAKQSPDLVALGLDSAQSPADTLSTFVRSAVAEAHVRKLRVIAEVSSVPQLRAAVEAGADAIVLRAADEIPDELVARLASQQTVVVPVLAVGDAAARLAAGDQAVEPYEKACAPAATLEAFASEKPTAPAGGRQALEAAAAGECRNLKRLIDGGVVIAAGSGAGERRVFHGAALHREFALMADAGMTPMQILLSATRHAARLLGAKPGVGELKVGMAGDLVLLDADPTVDIRNASRVVQTIKGGAIYER